MRVAELSATLDAGPRQQQTHVEVVAIFEVDASLAADVMVRMRAMLLRSARMNASSFVRRDTIKPPPVVPPCICK